MQNARAEAEKTANWWRLSVMRLPYGNWGVYRGTRGGFTLRLVNVIFRIEQGLAICHLSKAHVGHRKRLKLNTEFRPGFVVCSVVKLQRPAANRALFIFRMPAVAPAYVEAASSSEEAKRPHRSALPIPHRCAA